MDDVEKALQTKNTSVENTEEKKEEETVKDSAEEVVE